MFLDHFTAATFAMLTLTALVAGFIDAIAGGGGLLTLPALALAGIDPLAVFGTNKLQASFGSGSASFAFWRAGHIHLRRDWSLVVMSAVGAILGAFSLQYVPVDRLSAALPFVLSVVALYFLLSPRASDLQQKARMSLATYTMTLAPLIGAYDGLFGPGTGSFYMIGFVSLCGLPMIAATGRTKLCNFASNIASLIVLIMSGKVLWVLGLAMGLAQWVGAWVGSHVAMRAGQKLIRPALVCLCLVLAAHLAKQEHLLPETLNRFIP